MNIKIYICIAGLNRQAGYAGCTRSTSPAYLYNMSLLMSDKTQSFTAFLSNFLNLSGLNNYKLCIYNYNTKQKRLKLQNKIQKLNSKTPRKYQKKVSLITTKIINRSNVINQTKEIKLRSSHQGSKIADLIPMIHNSNYLQFCELSSNPKYIMQAFLVPKVYSTRYIL